MNPLDQLAETQENIKTEKEDFSKPLSSYEKKEAEWLWKDRIPKNCVTIIEGDGGVGKSFIITSIASDLSKGRALFDTEAADPKSVLLLASEDDPSVVLRPRFESHMADLDRIHIHDQSMLLNHEGIEVLQNEIKKLSIDLVVIDPVVSFLGCKVDMSNAVDVRSFMKPLSEIASKQCCTIIVVRHWNKNSLVSASQRGSGSVDFRNAARSVLQAIKGKNGVYLCHDKSNYGTIAKTLQYSIVDKKIVWDGIVDKGADEIIAELTKSNSEEKTELQVAQDYLLDKLKDGPVLAKDIFNDGKICGYSEKTLRRAKQSLQIEDFRSSENKSFWRLKIDSDGQVEGGGQDLPVDEFGRRPGFGHHLYPGLDGGVK